MSEKPEDKIVKILEDNLAFLNDGMDPYSVAYLIMAVPIEPTEAQIENACREFVPHIHVNNMIDDRDGDYLDITTDKLRGILKDVLTAKPVDRSET